MPQNDSPKRRTLEEEPFQPNARSAFVELGLASCFSFLRASSDAVDLAATANRLGYDAMGIADHNTLAGVVRVHIEADKAQGVAMGEPVGTEGSITRVAVPSATCVSSNPIHFDAASSAHIAAAAFSAIVMRAP